MEILVCLKQVPDDSVELHLKPGTQEVNLEGSPPWSTPLTPTLWRWPPA